MDQSTTIGVEAEQRLTARVRAEQAAESELNEVAGGLNTLYGRLVDITVTYLAEPRLWQGEGIRSVEHWLCWRMGLTSSVARQITSIAQRADELPETLAQLSEGKLSLGQVNEIVRYAPWWADDQASRLAEHLTVSQLRRVLKATPFDNHPHPDDLATGDLATDDENAGDPPASNDDEAAPEPDPDSVTSAPVGDPESCQFGFDDQGRFYLHLLTDALTGSIIDAALREARDALFQSGQDDVTWVDAVREVAERSLDTVESPSRRDRFKLHFHLDVDGAAVDGANVSIPESIRKYLTCDRAWDPVFTKNAIPINVGRGERIVPERTRRIVVLRDNGCCRVPGCRQKHWLEIHHIIHWDEEGVTETWNLVALCPQHHRMHHRGELGITGNADIAGSLRFTNAKGRPITHSGASPVTRLKPERLCPPLRTYRPASGETLDITLVSFAPPWRQRKWRGVYPPPRGHPSRKTWKPEAA